MSQFIIAMDSAVGPVVGSLAALAIDGTTMVPLGAAAGVVWTVIKLSQRWQRLEDRIGTQERAVNELVKVMRSRPCFKDGCIVGVDSNKANEGD